MKEKIIELLSEKEMTITDLSKALRISKATASYHVERLQKEGLIRVAREERIRNFIKRYYTLSIPNANIGNSIISAIKNSADNKERAEFFKNTIRLIGFTLLKISPYLFKRIGYEVGKALSVEEAKIDDIAEIWEKLDLGKTSCSNDSLTVEDCYFCSGLPEVGYTYCKFDEGLISGFLKGNYSVREIKCWGLGYEFCEFKIKRVDI